MPRNINEYADSVGFGSGTNRTKFETDGTIVKENDATGWEDIVGSLLGRALSSASGKVGYNWGENSITFNPGGSITTEADRLVFNMQFPHSAKVNSSLKLHVHWEQDSATEREFTVQYRVQSNNALKNTVWTTVKSYATIDSVFTYTSGTLNQITSLGTVDMTSAGISATVQFRMARTDSNVGDIDATFIDAHYEMDTDGSRTEYTK